MPMVCQWKLFILKQTITDFVFRILLHMLANLIWSKYDYNSWYISTQSWNMVSGDGLGREKCVQQKIIYIRIYTSMPTITKILSCLDDFRCKSDRGTSWQNGDFLSDLYFNPNDNNLDGHQFYPGCSLRCVYFRTNNRPQLLRRKKSFIHLDSHVIMIFSKLSSSIFWRVKLMIAL